MKTKFVLLLCSFGFPIWKTFKQRNSQYMNIRAKLSLNGFKIIHHPEPGITQRDKGLQK